jgi:hypothetical protein
LAPVCAGVITYASNARCMYINYFYVCTYVDTKEIRPHYINTKSCSFLMCCRNAKNEIICHKKC